VAADEPGGRDTPGIACPRGKVVGGAVIIARGRRTRGECHARIPVVGLGGLRLTLVRATGGGAGTNAVTQPAGARELHAHDPVGWFRPGGTRQHPQRVQARGQTGAGAGAARRQGQRSHRPGSLPLDCPGRAGGVRGRGPRRPARRAPPGRQLPHQPPGYGTPASCRPTRPGRRWTT
jgi:hypothetical protein